LRKIRRTSMNQNEAKYEPVLNFRKNKPQMQTEHVRHEELYEKAFLAKEETSHSEYGQNTTAWD
jgi:hypothetical protein